MGRIANDNRRAFPEKVTLTYEKNDFVFRAEACFPESVDRNGEMTLVDKNDSVVLQTTFPPRETVSMVLKHLREMVEAWTLDPHQSRGTNAHPVSEIKVPKRQTRKGRPMDEETKRKISQSLKGRSKGPMSSETREKISRSMKGKKADSTENSATAA